MSPSLLFNDLYPRVWRGGEVEVFGIILLYIRILYKVEAQVTALLKG